MKYMRLINVKKIYIASILLALFSSCNNVPENMDISQADPNIEFSELDNSEKENELQEVLEFETISEDEQKLLENTEFTVFESNELKLLYPKEWTLHSRTDTATMIDETVIAEHEIIDLNIEKDYPFFVRIRINDNSMVDGDFEQKFEQRKERLRQFLALSPNFEDITFEEIIINNDIFYKVHIPIVDGRREIILTTVKNNKIYDIFSQYDSTYKDDFTVIEGIFNSIEIPQLDE